jgi:hypothetical protein
MGSTERGSSILEFALAGSFIFLPLLAGLSTVGFQMVRSMQIATLTRDAGHMFATGIDFSQTSNQPVLGQIAGSSLSLTDGTGVIIFSEIDDTTNGPVTNQYAVGGGSGSSKYVDSSGNPTASAAALTSAMQPGQSVFIVESYFNTPTGMLWSGALPGSTGVIYSKAIF